MIKRFDMKIALLLAVLAVFTTITIQDLSAQDCDVWTCPLGHVVFKDTNVVVVLSGDFDHVNFRVGPSERPRYLHVSKNMLYGVPLDSLQKHIDLLEAELVDERSFLTTNEYKTLFLKKMAILIFYEYKTVEQLDPLLIATVRNLIDDPIQSVSQNAQNVKRMFDYYSE